MEDIDEMVMKRLSLGSATTDQIKSSLIASVNRDWLVRRMNKLKEDKKVALNSQGWCLPKTEEATPQKPVESPTAPATPPIPEKSPPLELKELIMLEIKEAGPLKTEGLVIRLKTRDPSAKVYNTLMYDNLYKLEKERRLVKEKVGRGFQWRIPTEEEAKAPQLYPPIERRAKKEKPPAIPINATPPGMVETSRKYHIPIEEVKKRFPELLGTIIHITIVEVKPLEFEMLFETEEKS
jgi:hypothetical protein